jgi:hypothetical protein
MIVAPASLLDQFVHSLGVRDFASLESTFAPDIGFRALVPPGLREAHTRSEAGGQKPADADDRVRERVRRRDDHVFDLPQVLFLVVLNAFAEEFFSHAPADEEFLELDHRHAERNFARGRRARGRRGSRRWCRAHGRARRHRGGQCERAREGEAKTAFHDAPFEERWIMKRSPVGETPNHRRAALVRASTTVLAVT